MWFPTEQKVYSAIDALVADCRLIDERLKVHEAQQQAFGSMIDRSGSFGRDLKEMRDFYFLVHGGLIETSLGIQFGKVTPRQASRVVKHASKRVAELKLILDQMEAGAAAGRAAFKQRFGSDDDTASSLSVDGQIVGSTSKNVDEAIDHKEVNLQEVAKLKANIPRLQNAASDERLSPEARARAARLVRILSGSSPKTTQSSDLK
jgi:hypothetical protein